MAGGRRETSTQRDNFFIIQLGHAQFDTLFFLIVYLSSIIFFCIYFLILLFFTQVRNILKLRIELLKKC
jgi:hypothetical protein